MGGDFISTVEVVDYFGYILGTLEEVEEIRDKVARKEKSGAMSCIQYPQIVYSRIVLLKVFLRKQFSKWIFLVQL